MGYKMSDLNENTKPRGRWVAVVAVCLTGFGLFVGWAQTQFDRLESATENCRSYATQLERALGETNAALTATQDDQELLANWHVSQAQDAISGTNRLAKLCYEVR